MSSFHSGLVVLFLLCASSSAWAQTTAKPVEEGSDEGDSNAPLFLNPHEQYIGPGAATFVPQINPFASPQGGQLSEDAQRKLVGAVLMGISVPMFVYGLQKINSDAKWVAGRNLTARASGAALFGGALNAGQGALMLLTDGPKTKRQADIKLDPQNYRDPLIPLLHQDAMDARKSRQELGVLIGVGGALAGAVIAFLPVSDAKVNRWALVSAGLTTMAVGAGAGVYTYNSKPPEVEQFEAALERQSMMSKTRRPKLK